MPPSPRQIQSGDWPHHVKYWLAKLAPHTTMTNKRVRYNFHHWHEQHKSTQQKLRGSEPQCHHTKFEAAIDCTTWNIDLRSSCPIQQWLIRGYATTFTIGMYNTNQHSNSYVGPSHAASPVPILSPESILSWLDDQKLTSVRTYWTQESVIHSAWFTARPVRTFPTHASINRNNTTTTTYLIIISVL
jgi:hypothetical protein